MIAKNDITGDSIITKASSDAYRNNFEAIFGEKIKPVLTMPGVGPDDGYDDEILEKVFGS